MASATASGRDIYSSVKMRPLQRAQTLGDITSSPAPLKRRRSSLFTADSQAEKSSMRSSAPSLIIPTTSNNHHEEGSSHFHSTPLLFAVLPALGGVLFEGGSVILTDVCIILLACIFLNWSLRLPWYVEGDSFVTKLTEAGIGIIPLKHTSQRPSSLKQSTKLMILSKKKMKLSLIFRRNLLRTPI